MKIIYMATPPYAGKPMKAAIEAGHEVAAVVTRPPRKSGRGNKEPQQPPMYRLASELGIPVLQPEKINTPGFVKELEALEADLIVTAAYSAYLGAGVLNAAKYKTINIHPSLLPKYRGASPVQSALIQGETKTGVSILFSIKEMDAGDIVLQEEAEILPNETAEELIERMFELGGSMLCKVLQFFEKGDVPRIKQDEGEAAYFGKLEKETGLIDWNKPAREIHNLIRGTVPWPGAYTFIGGKKLQIWASRIFDGEVEAPGMTPGLVVRNIKQDGLIIATGDGFLLAGEVQQAGKKRMKAADWSRGVREERILFRGPDED